MKTSTIAALATCVSIIAFFAGRWISPPSTASEPQRLQSRATTLSTKSSRTSVELSEIAPPKPVSGCAGISTEQAARLTSKERLAALTGGAVVYQSGNQIAMLEGVISALTKDEMREAMTILGGIQDRGNFQTQQVWDAFWQQWGRVDPMGCIEDFDVNAQAKSGKDARNVMAGWLETNPAAALAWAMEPKTSPIEDVAAAVAITHHSNGDLRQLASAIHTLPAESLTTRECLKDYFDIATLTGKNPSAADIYAGLDPALRTAAWPVAMQRLALTDPHQAAAWLEKHANDPGRDYQVTIQFITELTVKDPVATVNWAKKLPGAREDESGVSPLGSAINSWREIDPAAAEAWLESNGH